MQGERGLSYSKQDRAAVDTIEVGRTEKTLKDKTRVVRTEPELTG